MDEKICARCEWWDSPPNPTKEGATSPNATGYCLHKGVTARGSCCERYSPGLWQYRHTPESTRRRAEAKAKAEKE